MMAVQLSDGRALSGGACGSSLKMPADTANTVYGFENGETNVKESDD